MRSFITKKAMLSLGLALVLAAGGVATASNMGFKFVKGYSRVSPNINSVSLPYFQSQFTMADQLFTDVPFATQVCNFNPNGSYNCWTPGSFNNFPIVKGEGYAVGVSNGTSTEVIVGSHDPSFSVSLSKVSPNINVVSLPYHMTYTMADQIFTDIPGATQVCNFSANGSYNCWTPGSFNNFATVIGDAIAVGVNPATTWVPDHY